MKRIFSVKNKNFLKTTLILFALLSSTVALWAQPQSSTDYNIFAYRLKCTAGDQYMYPMGTTDGSYAGTNNSNNANNYWYFVPSGTTNYYYIRNLATGQYLYVTSLNHNTRPAVKVSSSTNASDAQTYLFSYSREQGQGNENNYYITPLGTDADLDSWGGGEMGLYNNGGNAKWNFNDYKSISISTHNPSSNPISVDGASGNGIQLVRANTFDISYKSFSFWGTTYYQIDGVQTTTLPNFTSATYSWSLASGDEYATISADGVLTSKGVATTMQTVTVKLTATVGGKNYSVTKDIQIQDFSEQLATLSLSGPDVINTVNASQPVQANWSGSYTPAYTNYKYDYNDHNVFNGQIYSNIPTLYSLTGCTLTWSLSGEGAPYATVEANATAGNVTYNTEAPHDVVVGVMLNVTHANYPGLSLNAGPHNMTLYSTTINPPVINYEAGDDFVTISSILEGSTVYTLDGTDPDYHNGPGTAYSDPITLTSSPTTIKAVTERWGHVSSIAEKTVYLTCATPEITIASGQVTITAAPSDATIYYTTDGSTPSSSATEYEGMFNVMPGATIKAITIKSGWENSEVATKEYELVTTVTETSVVINDLEDHRWLYYQTARPDEQYPQVLISPDPRNVKIIYRGGGVTNGSAVAISADAGEGQNEIVYYKTLEKVEGGRWLTGNYPYKVIPNPFSKRPAVTNGGNKTYYGFYGWKIVNGGEYINGKNNNDVLELEEVIHFVNLPYSDTNCISATIELEATWTQASVAVNGTSGLSGSNYETNFIIYNSTGNVTVNGNTPATVSNRYPDGTAAGGNPVVNSFTSNADLKLEYIKIGDGITPVHPITPTTMSSTSAGSGTFNIGTGWLIIGRGCTGTVNYLRPTNNSSNNQIKMRLESGKYTKIEMMRNKDNGNADNNAWGRFVLGCDYDRAKDDGVSDNGTGDNTKLRVVTIVALSGNGAAPGNDQASDYLDVTVKSGYYGYSANYALFSGNRSSYTNMDGYGVCTGGNTDNSINNSYTTVDINGNTITYDNMSTDASDNTFFKMHSFYCGRTRGGGKGGVNHIWIEGGEFNSFNCGGSTIPENTIKTHLRIKGGWFKGAVYGTSSTSVVTGSEKMVITGGEINGWVSGGCNGTDFNDKGTLTGTTYVYVGGNAQLRAHQYDAAGNPVYNNAWGLVFGMEGGIIFGSGRGLPPVNSDNCKYSGSATNSYIVVADNSFVEQNIYGGGCNGIAQNSHIYLMGGVVGGKVFGGTMKAISTDDTWRSRTSDIRMYGGWVKEGIYGGHDETGIQYDNASVKIYGGKVGVDIDHLANIHGGGYGNNTFTRGSVDVTIGKQNATDGATIFGDVYGGSAMGKVNGESNRTNDAVTNVTLNAGTINGALYGGGLGTSTYAADVYGPVQVKVYGGSVKTTDGTGNNGSGGVYGCNNTNGEPKSTVNVDIYHTDPAPSADEYALHAVYGGGNKADYAQGTPHVTVHRCDNSIEYVYGGGNAADITHATNGNTDVTIYGGDVIGNVFGGGNGSAPGTEANVSGGTNVKIYGGTILNVFGGSNTSGTIGGNIKVLAESMTESGESNCPMDVKSLFAGGNLAACNGGTVTVNCGAKVDDVYGGANMADINNNIHLVINGGNIHRVFGGNNASGAITGTITVDINVTGGCGDTIGYVYGGGNQAPYTAPDSDKNCPKVNVIKGHVLHDVYGGGLGLKTDATKGTITGNPQVKIYKGQVRIDGNVFGGGNAGKVFGNTNVQVGVTE